MTVLIRHIRSRKGAVGRSQRRSPRSLILPARRKPPRRRHTPSSLTRARPSSHAMSASCHAAAARAPVAAFAGRRAAAANRASGGK
eukprot:31065-Pelagococcus_subviridis.AAC.1